MKQTTTRYILR